MKSKAIIYLNLELTLEFTAVKEELKSWDSPGYPSYNEIDKVRILGEEISEKLLNKLFEDYDAELTEACEEQAREDRQEKICRYLRQDRKSVV